MKSHDYRCLGFILGAISGIAMGNIGCVAMAVVAVALIAVVFADWEGD